MSEHLHELLQAVRDGSISVEQAELELKKAPFEDLGYAKIDFHRSLQRRSSTARARHRRRSPGSPPPCGKRVSSRF